MCDFYSSSCAKIEILSNFFFELFIILFCKFGYEFGILRDKILGKNIEKFSENFEKKELWMLKKNKSLGERESVMTNDQNIKNILVWERKLSYKNKTVITGRKIRMKMKSNRKKCRFLSLFQ